MSDTHKPSPATPVDTLYYDGQCPLCLREMTHLGRLKDSHLILQDIHKLEASADLPPKSQLLETLHLQRHGKWLTGVDASVAAWQHTQWGVLWRWMRWPMIAPIMDWGYRHWARWRYRRLYGPSCSAGDSCS